MPRGAQPEQPEATRNRERGEDLRALDLGAGEHSGLWAVLL
jgi:hypothetical protein